MTEKMPPVVTEIRVFTLRPKEFMWAVRLGTGVNADGELCVARPAGSYLAARTEAIRFCRKLQQSASQPVCDGELLEVKDPGDEILSKGHTA